MNGRVQDPLLGRFLSPDPIVQAPYHSQSLNRYSYVWNNPLTFVDPSGFQIRCADGNDRYCGDECLLNDAADGCGHNLGLGEGSAFHTYQTPGEFYGSLWSDPRSSGGEFPAPDESSGTCDVNCYNPRPGVAAPADDGLGWPQGGVPNGVEVFHTYQGEPDLPLQKSYPVENVALFAVSKPIQGAKAAWYGGRAALLGISGAIRYRLAFSAAERALISEARALLSSAGFAEIRAAHAAGQNAIVNIGGRTVQYEATYTYSQAMTIGEANAFVLGPRAFASPLETAKTIGHELFRLQSGTLGYAEAGQYSRVATDAAYGFAERAGSYILGGVK
jgi:hypothetical protein